MEGDWWAKKKTESETMRPPWGNSKITDQGAAKSVVNVIDRAVQGVELSASLATFLKFALKAAENMVEGETAFAGRTHAAAHAAHTNESLWLHRRTSLTSDGRPLTVKIERVAGTSGGCYVLVVA